MSTWTVLTALACLGGLLVVLDAAARWRASSDAVLTRYEALLDEYRNSAMRAEDVREPQPESDARPS